MRLNSIVTHELSCLFRAPSALGSASAWLVLVVAATWISCARQTRELSQQALAEQSFSTQWTEQAAKNPHSAAHFGTWIWQPRAPLEWFDPGLTRFTGRGTQAEAHLRNSATFRPGIDRPGVGLLPDLSPSTLLQIVAPLLVILLGHGCLSGERERRTLPLLLVGGRSPRTLILGKLLAHWALVLTGLVVTLVASVVTAVILDQGWPDAPTMVGLVLGYALYCTSWVGLVATISMFAHHRQTSLAIGFCAWIALVLVAPRVLAEVAERRHPVEPAAVFDQDARRLRREGLDGHDPQSERSRQFTARILQEHGVTDEKDLPFYLPGVMMQADEEYGSKVYRKKYGEYYEAAAAQSAFLESWSWINPLMNMTRWSAATTATSLSVLSDYSEAVEEYRVALMGFLNDDLARGVKAHGLPYRSSRETWARAPQFHWRPPEVANRWQAHKSDLARLGALALLPVALPLILASRLRP